MKRLVGSAAVVVVAGLLVTFVAKSCNVSSTPANVDSLLHVNRELGQRNSILQAALAPLELERDQIRKERDSLRQVSDAATEELKQRRKLLPPVAQVPDSMLRASYAEAIAQLDDAFAALARKDRIIHQYVQDSIKTDSIEKNVRQQLANVTAQYTNEQTVSAGWKQKYEEEKSWCGKKCGIAIGVGGVLLTAIVVDKVRDLTNPPKAQMRFSIGVF